MERNAAAGRGTGGEPEPNPINALRTKSMEDLARLANQLPIRWEELRGIPFYGPLLGFTDTWRRASVGMFVFETRWRAQRTLTPDEVQILAAQMAKMTSTQAHELPFLVGTAYFFEQRGRRQFRFPFLQPGASFSPECFPSPIFPFVQGATARAAWHVARAASYVFASHFALRILFISYSMSVHSAEFSSDKRLANLRDWIRRSAENNAAAAARRRPSPATAPPPIPVGVSADAGYDETSVVGSMGGEQQQQQPPPPPLRSPLPTSMPPSMPPPMSQSTPSAADVDDLDDGGFFDDASPVSAAEQRSARRSQQDPAAGAGSAWDRIRTQAAQGGPDPSHRVQHTPPVRSWKHSHKPDADSGDYAIGERGAAKDDSRGRAQQDFDAMLERERRGEGDADERRRW